VAVAGTVITKSTLMLAITFAAAPKRRAVTTESVALTQDTLVKLSFLAMPVSTPRTTFASFTKLAASVAFINTPNLRLPFTTVGLAVTAGFVVLDSDGFVVLDPAGFVALDTVGFVSAGFVVLDPVGFVVLDATDFVSAGFVVLDPVGFVLLDAAGFVALDTVGFVSAGFVVLDPVGFVVLDATGFVSAGFVVLDPVGFVVLDAAGFVVFDPVDFVVFAGFVEFVALDPWAPSTRATRVMIRSINAIAMKGSNAEGLIG